MTADDVRAQAVTVVARLLSCNGEQVDDWAAAYTAGQPSAEEIADALVEAGLLAAPPVAWGIGLHPDDGGPVTVDETWLDRDQAVREVQAQVEEFDLDLRLYEIREGDE